MDSRRADAPPFRETTRARRIETMDELAPEVEALRKIPFFEDLTPEDLDRIARIGERRSFAPGDPIVAKDAVGVGCS